MEELRSSTPLKVVAIVPLICCAIWLPAIICLSEHEKIETDHYNRLVKAHGRWAPPQGQLNQEVDGRGFSTLANGGGPQDGIQALAPSSPSRDVTCVDSHVLVSSAEDCGDNNGSCTVSGTFQLDLSGSTSCIEVDMGGQGTASLAVTTLQLISTGECSSPLYASCLSADGHLSQTSHNNDGWATVANDAHSKPMSCGPRTNNLGGYFPCDQGAGIDAMTIVGLTPHPAWRSRSVFAVFNGGAKVAYGQQAVQRSGEGNFEITHCAAYEAKVILSVDILKDAKPVVRCIYVGTNGLASPKYIWRSSENKVRTLESIDRDDCVGTLSYLPGVKLPDSITAYKNLDTGATGYRLSGQPVVLSEPQLQCTHALFHPDPDLKDKASTLKHLVNSFETTTSKSGQVHNLVGTSSYNSGGLGASYYSLLSTFLTCPIFGCIDPTSLSSDTSLGGGSKIRSADPLVSAGVGMNTASTVPIIDHVPSGRATLTSRFKVIKSVHMRNDIVIDRGACTGTYGPTGQLCCTVSVIGKSSRIQHMVLMAQGVRYDYGPCSFLNALQCNNCHGVGARFSTAQLMLVDMSGTELTVDAGVNASYSAQDNDLPATVPNVPEVKPGESGFSLSGFSGLGNSLKGVFSVFGTQGLLQTLASYLFPFLILGLLICCVYEIVIMCAAKKTVM